MRAIVIGFALIGCSAKPAVAPLTNSAPSLPGLHVAGELPAPAMRLTNCVADHGDGQTTQDEAGHITEQRCAMSYDCSGWPGAPATPTSGDALLSCTGSDHATCRCELTHFAPKRVDTFSFAATKPCGEGELEKLFVRNCSTLFTAP